jgi:hypothetical protein
MTQYWWVNHKQTVRQEIDGQYLWSPKTNSNGARNEFYNNMRRADPGDIVLSYAEGKIGYIGRVTEFEEFGQTGAYWNREGWLLPVFWTPLAVPVRPKEIIRRLGPLLPKTHSPIRPETGDGNQGVYLAAIPKPVFEMVTAGTAYSAAAFYRGGANSLNFQVVSEQLDDIVEGWIKADLTLDHTVRESVIQARRGQGKFRANVEAVERACRLTGITNPTLLIASHIKPWRLCDTAGERLDGMNGLLLTPDADLLFDRGFITFENDGEVRVSPRMDRLDLKRSAFSDRERVAGRALAERPLGYGLSLRSNVCFVSVEAHSDPDFHNFPSRGCCASRAWQK